LERRFEMAENHFVVIGNGPAGNEAALTLCRHAGECRVTLISRQRGGCYRPHLLPQLISGKLAEENLYVFSPSSYKEMGIKLRSGQEVVNVYPDRGEIILDHKEVIPFDGLIIAVGGRPRIPEDLAVFGDLMLTLKTIRDARVWIQKLERTETVLMIGGDLTSLSLTRQLMDMEKKVYFALNEDAFWPLRFDRDLFDQVAQRLSQRGVEVLKYSRIRGMRLLPDGMVEMDTEHEKVRAGVVGAFFGLVPDIRFLARSGLKLDRGILVDEYLNTGFDGVYATGDCAQVFHPELRDYWISIGHDNAVALGRTAALNLIGERVKAEPAPECIFDVQGVCVNNSWWMEF
jgi:NADPH-dependent 2,4-dienoyl-CoA reductase/sulfur reductase-like enzyme